MTQRMHTARLLADLDERSRLIDLAVDADRHAVRPLAYPGRTDLLVDGYGVTVHRSSPAHLTRSTS